jgi:hypothetical protein
MNLIAAHNHDRVCTDGIPAGRNLHAGQIVCRV